MAYTRRGFVGGAKKTTLNGEHGDSAVTIHASDLSTWAGATSNGPATATISYDETDEETITFTAISGNDLTGVTRGAAGTTQQAHSSGATLRHTSSKVDFDEANAHIADATLDHHSQYARVNGSRAFTGAQAFSAGLTTTTLAASGAATFATTVAVTGASTFTGLVTANGGLTVAGAIGFTTAAAFITGTSTTTTPFTVNAANGHSVNIADLKINGSVYFSFTKDASLQIGGGISGASGDNALYISNAASPPGSNPTGGGIMYVSLGALKYRGSAGTVTTLANA